MEKMTSECNNFKGEKQYINIFLTLYKDGKHPTVGCSDEGGQFYVKKLQEIIDKNKDIIGYRSDLEYEMDLWVLRLDLSKSHASRMQAIERLYNDLPKVKGI